MNKIAQFIQDPLSNRYSFPFKSRATTSIAIIKRYISFVFISLLIILLLSIFISQRQINSLNQSIASLSQDNTSLRTDISLLQTNTLSDSQSNKRELTEMKELLISLTNEIASIKKELKSRGEFSDSGYDQLKESAIVTTPQQIDFIHQLFSSSQRSYRLLYRATRSGDTFNDLYHSIQDTNSTLVLIKSKKGAIFGGYSKYKWSVTGNHIVMTDKMNDYFLFNVNKKKNYSKVKDKICQPRGILSFGDDLIIEDSFLSLENTSEFPTNFNYVMYWAEKFSLTEGEEKFRIEEVEIYKVGVLPDL